MLIRAIIVPEDYEASNRLLGNRLVLVGLALGLLAVTLPIWPRISQFIVIAAASLSQQWSSGSFELRALGLIGLGFVVAVLSAGFLAGSIRETFKTMRAMAPQASDAIIKRMVADGVIGPHFYKIHNDGLKIVGPFDSMLLHWSLIGKIVETPRTLRLSLDKAHWLIVPKSAVTSDSSVLAVRATVQSAKAGKLVANVFRQPRLQNLKPARFAVAGRIVLSDLLALHDWRAVQQSDKLMRPLLRAYQHPLFFLFSLLFCGWSAFDTLWTAASWVLGFDPDLDAEDISFFGCGFSLVLLYGLASSLLRYARYLSGFALGFAQGPEGYKWGDFSFSITESGVQRTSAQLDDCVQWHGFKHLDETKHLFILRNSLLRTFMIPKRFFANETEQQAFREFVKNKLNPSK
jgi:YcxB-like protein